MSDDRGFVDHPAPSGFRIYRGAELIGERKCVLCPSRSCDCLFAAFDLAKTTAFLRGGRVVVETIEGVELTRRERAVSTGNVKRSGPAKPPRRARAETIRPPAPEPEPAKTSDDDEEHSA